MRLLSFSPSLMQLIPLHDWGADVQTEEMMETRTAREKKMLRVLAAHGGWSVLQFHDRGLVHYLVQMKGNLRSEDLGRFS